MPALQVLLEQLMKFHPPSHWSLLTSPCPLHTGSPSLSVSSKGELSAQPHKDSAQLTNRRWVETGSEAELWNRKFIRGVSPEEPQERKGRFGWNLQRQWHLLAGKEAIEVSGRVVPFQRKASPGFRSTQEGTWMPHLQKEVPGKDSGR